MRRSCAKCGGRLERGYTPEARDLSYKVDQWIEGEPRKGIFGFRLKGARKFDIEVWRCDKCGALEHYAPGK